MDLLACAICTDSVPEVIELPCEHCFCQPCLEDYVEDINGGQSLKCPLCQTDCSLSEGGIEALPKRRAQIDHQTSPAHDYASAESMKCSGTDCHKPAQRYCQSGCGYLCDQCTIQHSMVPFTKAHATKLASEVAPEETEASRPQQDPRVQREPPPPVQQPHSAGQEEEIGDLKKQVLEAFKVLREQLDQAEERMLKRVDEAEKQWKVSVIVKEVGDRPDSQSAPHLNTWTTSWSVGGVTGIATFQDHLLLVHWNDHHIYVYNPEGQKMTQFPVPELGNPSGLALLPKSESHGARDKAAISDWKGLLWMVDVQSENMANWHFSNISKEYLDYQPDGVGTGHVGQLLVADGANHKIHIYNTQLIRQCTVDLPEDVKPWQVCADPISIGYVIPDRQNKQVVWVNENGEITKKYTGDGYTIRPDHIVCDADGNCVVAESPNHTVELVSSGGKHRKLLVRKKDNVRQPRRLCLDEKNRRLYIAHKGTDECTPQILVVRYPSLE